MNVRLAVSIAGAFEVLGEQFKALGRLSYHHGVQIGTPVKTVYFKIVIVQAPGHYLGVLPLILSRRQEGGKRQRARHYGEGVEKLSIHHLFESVVNLPLD